MKVSEALTFEQYWSDPRFAGKKANLVGSRKRAFGDNIYHRENDGADWIQESSHHSHVDGNPNPANIRADTQTNRVLIGEDYIYWGRAGPLIPLQFRQPGHDIRVVRGHKNKFTPHFVQEFVDWVNAQPDRGYLDKPYDWRFSPKLIKT